MSAVNLRLHNSYTDRKEVFKPQITGIVKLYVCGVTTYDYCHLGHARTYLVFDMLVRYLRSLGVQVKYVRNITDIDDKIIKRANEQNITPQELAEKYTAIMHEDFSALGLLNPDNEPRATEYICKMQHLVHKLINKNVAYVNNDNNGEVYFAVRKYKHYGELSKRSLDDLDVGSRVEVNINKNDPLDFILWKPAKSGEPSWESPWGPGRPGWHLECSTMAMDCLGDTLDIHGGGHDLKFPHHENECAQSSAATDKPFANYWMHVGFLNLNSEKMSKSLGNILNIREFLQQYPAEVLRYFILSSHYRSPVDYREELIIQSKQALTRLYQTLRTSPQEMEYDQVYVDKYVDKFREKMDDDLNTPEALAVLFEISHQVNRYRADGELEQAAKLASLLRSLGQSIGLLMLDPEVFLQQNNKKIDNIAIEKLIAERNAARAAKNWKLADQVRDQLLALNIELEDTASGTQWRVK